MIDELEKVSKEVMVALSRYWEGLGKSTKILR
jgi:hypothetical protein